MAQQIFAGYSGGREAGGPSLGSVDLEWAPCRVACPVHTDVPGYIALIARGKYQEAYELIKAVNPFPSVCALICHHPCEQECRRNDVDEPLAVRDLKRFVSEVVGGRRSSTPLKRAPDTGKKVAIIGAGPAGLTAALELVKLGHQVTVFEKAPVPGGLLATAIPKYRLPREVLERDVSEILSTGITLKTSCEVGKHVMLNDLKKNFDAVLLCVGLSLSRTLPIPGADAPGVLLALPFLASVNFEGRAPIGKNVIVIGGGNVAVDVARSARRLGAPYVKMVCLESEQEMPAWPWEIKEATEEGIEIIHRRGPRRILTDGKKITGLEMKAVKYVFDSNGNFNPAYYEDQISTTNGDTVIFAIGQRADLGFLQGTDVKVNERGQLIFNKATYQTTDPSVFVTGEVATGPGSAIEAIAHGRRVVEFIDRYLKGERLEIAVPPEPKKIEKFPSEYIPKIRPTQREKMRVIAGDVRVTSFQQFELGLTEIEAVKEARRCLNCGTGPVPDKDKCAACLLCLRLCPFGVPTIDQTAQMPSVLCQTCGLCAVDCPRSAIEMRGYPRNWLLEEARTVLAAGRKNGEPRIIAFTCTYNRTYPDSKVVALLPPGVTEIPVPCAGRVGSIDVLKTLEMGADAVYVVACNDRACKFEGADDVARKRILRVRDMLKLVGLDGRVDFFYAMTPTPERYVQIANEMLKRVKELGPLAKKPSAM